MQVESIRIRFTAHPDSPPMLPVLLPCCRWCLYGDLEACVDNLAVQLPSQGSCSRHKPFGEALKAQAQIRSTDAQQLLLAEFWSAAAAHEALTRAAAGVGGTASARQCDVAL